MEKFTKIRKCLQAFSLMLNILCVILIAFSLHHDEKWNEWVDENFNLNRKNTNHHLHIDDYIAAESQEDWINLLKRESALDVAFLILSIFCIYLTLLYLAICSPRLSQATRGAIMYGFCVLVLLVAGSVLTTSLVRIWMDENKIAELLSDNENDDNVKANTNQRAANPGVNESAAIIDFTQSYQEEVVIEYDNVHIENPSDHPLKIDTATKKGVICTTIDHSSNVFRQCQLYSFKFTAITFAFLNAAVCLLVTGVFTTMWWTTDSSSSYSSTRSESYDDISDSIYDDGNSRRRQKKFTSTTNTATNDGATTEVESSQRYSHRNHKNKGKIDDPLSGGDDDRDWRNSIMKKFREQVYQSTSPKS